MIELLTGFNLNLPEYPCEVPALWGRFFAILGKYAYYIIR